MHEVDKTVKRLGNRMQRTMTNYQGNDQANKFQTQKRKKKV